MGAVPPSQQLLSNGEGMHRGPLHQTPLDFCPPALQDRASHTWKLHGAPGLLSKDSELCRALCSDPTLSTPELFLVA